MYGTSEHNWRWEGRSPIAYNLIRQARDHRLKKEESGSAHGVPLLKGLLPTDKVKESAFSANSFHKSPGIPGAFVFGIFLLKSAEMHDDTEENILFQPPM
jgi:hypothetical protein